MMLLRTLFLGTIFSYCTLFSQEVEWLNAAPVGWNLNYQMPAHLIRASHNGHVSAAHQVGPGMSYGIDVFNSVVIEQVDPGTGAQLAWCMMSDSVLVESMAVADDGRTYVAGRFIGNVQFCDGNAMAGTGGFLDTDLFLAAFDGTNFGTVWFRNLSIAHPDGQGVPALELDADGTLWYGLEDFNSIHLISVDPQGNDDQEVLIQGTRTLGGFSFDPSNNIFVSGSTGLNSSPLVIGSLSTPVSDTYAMFVLHILADGTGDWVRITQDGTFSSPDVVAGPDGGAFVSGALLGATAWGTIQFHGPDWVSDVFIAAVNSGGDFLWGKESAPPGGPIVGDMARSRGPSLGCDANGNVYLTGTVRGHVDWGNGVISDALTFGSYSQTIVAFDGGGSALWQKTTVPGSINAQNVSCDDGGTVFFSAHANGPYTMDPTTVNNGGAQAFADGRINGLNTSTSEAGTAEVRMYPDPAADQIYIELPISSAGTFALHTLTGQCLQTMRLDAGLHTIDVRALDPGVYVLRQVNGPALRFIKQ